MQGKLPVNAVKLLDGATSVVSGDKHQPWGNFRTFQSVGATSAGAGAAVVQVEASNDGDNWINLGTINHTLSTTNDTGGFASDAAWRYVRARVESISGTGASVTVWLGS